MNPLRSHWVRMSVWTLVVSPLVALMVIATTDAPFETAIALTLYMWLVVCVILALIALVTLLGRAMGRAARALRR